MRAPRYPHNYGWVTGFGGEDDSTFTTDIGPLRVLLCAGLLLRPPWTGRSGILAIPAAWNDEPPGSCLPLWRNLAQQRGWAMVVANRYGFEEYAKGDRCDFSQAVSCIVDSNGDVVQSMRSEGSGAVLISEVSGPEPELRRAPWMTGGAEPTDFAPPGPQR